MGPFEMVVAIVLICSIAGVINNRNKHKARAGADEVDEGVLRRLEQLEQRVRVLEKIVTDRNYELRRELDELDTAS